LSVGAVVGATAAAAAAAAAAPVLPRRHFVLMKNAFEHIGGDVQVDPEFSQLTPRLLSTLECKT